MMSHRCTIVATVASLAFSVWATMAEGAGSILTWRVVAINGRATHGTDYWMEFRGTRVDGQFGCNDFTGPYEILGDGLRVTATRITRKVCGKRANHLDASGLAVLRKPMRESSTKGRLTYRNAAGSIELEAEQRP
jgi:heat shock protein HslJ